ncbi:rod shape-determining protein MreC [Ileibacterium valens]|nr:rod shape-determining protein MreC [Ileibacterium valens]
MRRFTKLQRGLIIANVLLIVISCAMLGLRQKTISNLGYSAWTYIKYGLIDYPLTSAGSMIQDVANLWHVYDDNEYLNQQLADQRSYQTLYEEERSKNAELEGLIEMKNAQEAAVEVSCRVISRPLDAWDQTFTISAGSSSSIEENMLVVSSDGAVGLVESVQNNTSVVRLLSSSEMTNDIAVQISLEDGSSVEGVLRGYDARENRYEVTLFDHEALVSPGQLVSTSGKGGNYPSGIYIGAVTGVKMSDDAIISTIYVQPVKNMNSFTYVTVIGNGVIS